MREPRVTTRNPVTELLDYNEPVQLHLNVMAAIRHNAPDMRVVNRMMPDKDGKFEWIPCAARIGISRKHAQEIIDALQIALGHKTLREIMRPDLYPK